MACADWLDSEEDRKGKQRRYLAHRAVLDDQFDEELAQYELNYERITDR